MWEAFSYFQEESRGPLALGVSDLASSAAELWMMQQRVCGAKIIVTRINQCQLQRVSMAPCFLLWVGPGSFVPGPCDSFELSYYPHFGALVYRTLKTKFCCQIKRQSSCYLIFLPPASFLLFLHPVPLVYHPALTLAGFLK